MADAAARTTAVRQVARLWPPAEAGTFRKSLARLTSGVAIAACWSAGAPSGVAVNSLTGVSVAPPRLLFCLDKTAPGHDELIAAEAIGLSLLTAADRELAELFLQDGGARRFDEALWSLDPIAPPRLRGALAAFAGPVRCRIDAGSSTLFIVDVSTADSRPGAPLLHTADSLRALA